MLSKAIRIAHKQSFQEELHDFEELEAILDAVGKNNCTMQLWSTPKGFYTDPEIKFDVPKMQQALKEVDSRVARQSPLGERDINAICLTQIPGDPNSITGGNVRGLFWTKPDSTYEEVQREEVIDEEKYSEFVKLFEDTYFKEMYDILTEKYKLGRVRLLWKLPRTTLSWHRDPEPRLHLSLIHI